MSIMVMSMMFKAPFGSANRKMVAVRLADFADDDGRGIWPSVSTVAEQCELSERTVQRTLSEFVDEGILVVVTEGGGRKTTRYDFDLSRVRALKKAAKEGPDSLAEHEGCHGVTGDNGDMRGDTVSPLGCHGVTRTVNEPSEEPSVEREACASDGQAGDNASTEALRGSGKAAFKAAHAAWPTFTSDSSPQAEREWFNLAEEDRVKAAAQAQRFCEVSRSEGRKLVCSFAVYLKERRWEKLAPAADKPERVIEPAFGPAWCAERLERLMAVKLQPVQFTAFERRAIAEGMLDERVELAKKQVSQRRQMLGFMDGQASEGKGAAVSASAREAGRAFVPVSRGSAAWVAWQARFEALGWPWLPDMGRHEVAYFPAGPAEEFQGFRKDAA